MTTLADPSSCPAARLPQGQPGAERPPRAPAAYCSATALAMQDLDRKRIAAELHDSIGQSLSALCFGLGVAMEGIRKGNVRSAGEVLEKLSMHVKEAIGEVQRIAMDLRPPLFDGGLIGALDRFVRDFRSLHAGLTVTADLDVEERDVPPASHADIFRLLQEALSNVARHSRATEVHIRLRRLRHEIQFEVADNGRGFDPRDADRVLANGSGLGLRGMRERAELSGGRIRFESVPGQGTRILVAWPLRRQSRAN